MELFGKALHEFSGTKPGESPAEHAERSKEDEGNVPEQNKRLREAAAVWAAWCITDLEGMALALGLNIAYSVSTFLNYLEERGKDKRGPAQPGA
jgi:hypothetical protein